MKDGAIKNPYAFEGSAIQAAQLPPGGIEFTLIMAADELADILAISRLSQQGGEGIRRGSIHGIQ